MLVQMSGIPGTGKSTLAGTLGARLGLVVLDTDVVKSALLRNDVLLEPAGRATYAATLDVAAHLLAQGHSVIVDSPCRYRELLDAGQQVALDAGVPYRLIEQPPAGTDWESGTPLATLSTWQSQLVRPFQGWIRLDATRPAEENLAEAIAFLSPSPGPPAATH